MKVEYIALVVSAFAAPTLGAIISGPVVNPENGHTYYLLSQNTWTASEAEAVTLGGHLASIDDAAENAFVHSTFALGDRGLWIGLNDMASEGSFAWSSGDTVTYTNWNPNEPGDGIWGNYVYIIGQTNAYPGAVAAAWDDVPNSGSQFFATFGVVEVIPEPASLSLMVLGTMNLLRRRWR